MFMAEQPRQIEREVTIVNTQGLHARPVMRFVDLASQFSASVTIEKGRTRVDGKSPMEMMLLEASEGTKLKLVAEGEDAQAMLDALTQLIADKFNEE